MLFFRFSETLYDSVDSFGTLDQASLYEEEFLVRRSTYLCTISPALQEKFSIVRTDVHLVPAGCTGSITQVKKQYEHRKQPHSLIIGYAGAIDFRLDYSLLFRLIRTLPKMQFVFVGKVGLDEQGKKVSQLSKTLFSFSNVTHIPFQPKKNLPAIIQSFAVCIIPFDLSHPFVWYSNPMKTYEYMAMEKPIVTTAIPSLQRYTDVLFTAKNTKEFIQIIQQVDNKPMSKKQISLGKRIVRLNTWAEKISTIESIIQS